MSRIVNIAFQGGTHGNFLRYCIDRFSRKTPKIEGTPFSENNTSHKKLNYSDSVYHYHPSEKAPFFTNSDEPHILITVDVEDLVFLERWVTIRAGDFNIDTDYDKVWLSRKFLDHFPWKKKLEKYYKLDLSKKPAPRYVIRDFYKLTFLDSNKNGFIEFNKLLLENKPKNTFCFPVSNFWDSQSFKIILQKLDETFNLELDLSDLEIHDTFLSKVNHISTRHRSLEVIEAIKNKKDIDISNLDTVEQAYISAWIENNNRFILVPQSNSFFTTTGEINEWLETYPEHYKAMNPNLPTFNGIPNPFHLWNLKK